MAKMLIRGLFPRMTTSPAITGPNNPVKDGDTVTIRRGAWDYAIEDNETLTLDGVDVLDDVVENLDGTYSLTLSGFGLLEYIVTPRFGPARTRRVEVDENIVPVWLIYEATAIDASTLILGEG